MAILTLRKGDTLALRATFTDDVTGAAFPMTGWSIEATMKFSTCPAIELDATWADQPGGIASVKLAADQTEVLNDGEHEMRVRLTSPAGDRLSASPQVIQVSS